MKHEALIVKVLLGGCSGMKNALKEKICIFLTTSTQVEEEVVIEISISVILVKRLLEYLHQCKLTRGDALTEDTEKLLQRYQRENDV